MKKYENFIQNIYLLNRLKEFFFLFIIDLKKFFVIISLKKIRRDYII